MVTLTKLGAMMIPAFNGGKLAASYKRIETTKNKNVFRRDKEGKELIYIANLNSKSSEFKVPVTGKFIKVWRYAEQTYILDHGNICY